MRLEGKTAIITGAGRGLGRAVAILLAREGARVTLMSRTREQLEAVSREIEGQGGKALVFRGDVAVEQAVSAMVSTTVATFESVDILVNNAAIIGPARFLNDTDVNTWDYTIDVNLNGAFYCSRSVVPIMARNGGGKIINISSGLGQMPYPRFCAYAVSKAGIIQLTRSLSAELRSLNIQVNAVDPDVMDTSMQDRIRELGPEVLGEEIYQRLTGFKQRGLLIDPFTVASVIPFIVSSDDDNLTGHNGSLDDYARLGWN